MQAVLERLRALLASLWPWKGDDAHLWVEPENRITRQVLAAQAVRLPALPPPAARPGIATHTMPAAPALSASLSTSELDRAVASAAAAAALAAKSPATRREAPVPTRTARRRSRRAA